MAKPKPSSPKGRRSGQAFFYRGKKITKKQRMIDMLRRLKGTTVGDIAAELGWQESTVRGVMHDVLRKKLGLNIVLISERIYGIR
jgi:DNA-binding NarL/FixJ family response regulator